MRDILIHHYSDINAEKVDRGFIIMMLVVVEPETMSRVFGFYL